MEGLHLQLGGLQAEVRELKASDAAKEQRISKQVHTLQFAFLGLCTLLGYYFYSDAHVHCMCCTMRRCWQTMHVQSNVNIACFAWVQMPPAPVGLSDDCQCCGVTIFSGAKSMPEF